MHFCSWALGALVPGAPLCSSRSPLEVLGSFSLFLGASSLGFLGLAAGLLWFPSGAPFWIGFLWPPRFSGLGLPIFSVPYIPSVARSMVVVCEGWDWDEDATPNSVPSEQKDRKRSAFVTEWAAINIFLFCFSGRASVRGHLASGSHPRGYKVPSWMASPTTPGKANRSDPEQGQ